MASDQVKALYDYDATEKDELSFKYVLFSLSLVRFERVNFLFRKRAHATQTR